MKYKYSYKFVRMAPRKVRLITNLVKDMSPQEALDQLKFNSKYASTPVYELIKSATSSLKNKNINIEDIKIYALTCDEGPTLKRRQYKSRGRAVEIKKRTSHINLVLESKDIKKPAKVKANSNKKETEPKTRSKKK